MYHRHVHTYIRIFLVLIFQYTQTHTHTHKHTYTHTHTHTHIAEKREAKDPEVRRETERKEHQGGANTTRCSTKSQEGQGVRVCGRLGGGG